MINKKIKCVHCNKEMTIDPTSIVAEKCTCEKVSMNNGVITEGVQGTDWIDISPQLLNE